ncbi:APC family permease [Paraburkholderia caballeronis]|uniref:Amino acid transporter n=1 Tax=Paraburkholderia caballeronis TaxID=416943 RepID=A0A1H7VDR2_9BURK|nr:APC family permease [Paraburkholderia caballeronis]PXW16910.1 amino acid/polyamine/organocation transporter (APC superfamily) [Paraburkholderia caballeronis]PXW94642.1 amino acid/polyamine/organocation transporter (APC superfamily) [Paraburkholderia caballeronis]RAJ89967.1 amino acid/polyamine/organocation transporter (APC superfamily) [Paraburkholderia caballeronis]TDV05038.1 amino acid/polyamine/organocation transporter (APC superfamily) [Paraburkholderia caballeronis]TDV19171.1 amino aci
MKSSIQRNIGPLALMFTGLGSIIGSGWLFGAWKAAKIAGPAAICAWVIGAVVILAIALTYAELGAMFPESGGMVRYARYSHGALVGFISAWANWIAIVSVIPIEAEASIQYMSTWPYPWAHALFVDGSLTTNGLLLSAVLVVVYFMLNYWGVKLFARANTAITVFKFVIPGLTIIGLMAGAFHHENFGQAATFAPYGWSAVFTAVATSGIVFAFNGFQSPINLAGEARNPAKSVPFAVIGSILLALVIYVLLQIAYIGAVNPADVEKGWNLFNFKSPFAELAIALNLNWLAILLYIDAFVSPSGTGTTYMATTTRMIYAMERNNTMPKMFGNVHPLYGVPRNAMWFNLLVSFLFLFFFRGWSALAAVISVATVISYLTGPISLMALKRAATDLERPLHVPAMKVIAPFAFVCASLILYWAKWPLTGEIILLMVVALPVYFYFQGKSGWEGWGRDLKAAWWLVAYLPLMALLSLIGSKQFGGSNLIPYGWDMLTVAVFSLVFYFWGVNSGYRTEYLEEREKHDEILEGMGA